MKKPSVLLVEMHVRSMLRVLGLDVDDDPGLKDTPHRVAKMFVKELFRGLYTKAPKFTTFPNDGLCDQMIILRDIRVLSTCEHHMLPFCGRAHVAYIPKKNGRICGVSKLSRVVDWYARRPQIQERLTQQVADFLKKKLKPVGVMVVIEAQHHCMLCRGVQEDQAVMLTSAFHGEFEDQAVRDEFLRLIGR